MNVCLIFDRWLIELSSGSQNFDPKIGPKNWRMITWCMWSKRSQPTTWSAGCVVGLERWTTPNHKSRAAFSTPIVSRSCSNFSIAIFVLFSFPFAPPGVVGKMLGNLPHRFVRSVSVDSTKLVLPSNATTVIIDTENLGDCARLTPQQPGPGALALASYFVLKFSRVNC